MFFRETTSKNSKLPILKLVENIRTEKGPRQKIIVSLGAYFNLPKENRKEVARIVEERLLGQNNLFGHGPHLVSYADKIVKKIQTGVKCFFALPVFFREGFFIVWFPTLYHRCLNADPTNLLHLQLLPKPQSQTLVTDKVQYISAM